VNATGLPLGLLHGFQRLFLQKKLYYLLSFKILIELNWQIFLDNLIFLKLLMTKLSLFTGGNWQPRNARLSYRKKYALENCVMTFDRAFFVRNNESLLKHNLSKNN
jgi:hypothetical protein